MRSGLHLQPWDPLREDDLRVEDRPDLLVLLHEVVEVGPGLVHAAAVGVHAVVELGREQNPRQMGEGYPAIAARINIQGLGRVVELLYDLPCTIHGRPIVLAVPADGHVVDVRQGYIVAHEIGKRWLWKFRSKGRENSVVLVDLEMDKTDLGVPRESLLVHL